jgi:hypothetical protein
MGFSPAHWSQGTSDIVFPMDSCTNVVFQYAWQNANAVGREDVAREIAQAEYEIASYLGWWPAPTWVAQDVKMYPRPHRPDVYEVGGWNVRYQSKSIKTQYGKIIEPGQRAVTLINTAVVPVFTDADGDGFNETVTVSCATTLTDECEVKVYFDGHNGLPEWEIRPARTKTITGGTFTATFWAWQFIDPDLWDAIPTATTPIPSVDLDAAVYVGQVDVYREWNDPTAISSVMYWEPEPTSISGICSCCGGTGCTHCQLTSQCGCATIRNAELGYLTVGPATYDSDEGAWVGDEWSVCRDPDQVKLYYYCGDLSWLNLAGRECDGLSNEWARTIAFLATSRLRLPICECGSANALIEWLQTDLARIGGGESHVILWDATDNPFGTRRGEYEAWKYVSRLVRNSQAGAGAV